MPSEAVATSLAGVWELRGHYSLDKRGQFLNGFRAKDTAFLCSWGERPIQQVNVSRTSRIGTVRGIHLQLSPNSEAKLIRCLRGRVWDVAVDLRPQSNTFGLWHAVELSPSTANALLIPEGCAHGFQVLESDSELLYLHSGAWVPDSESGVHCCDPELAIGWPLAPVGLSERDMSLKSFNSLFL